MGRQAFDKASALWHNCQQMTDGVLVLVSVLHLAVAFFLIVFVLLQDSKGGALGALGTGGSHSIFGSTGASNFLVTITKWVAIVFTCTCLALTWHTTQQGSSVLDEVPLPAQESSTTTAPAQDDKDD